MFILFELFITFAKIGMFTFGGGYAMVSLAVISMILIKYFAFNISSMVLLMAFAIIGLSVFAIENRIYGEDTKE